MWTFVRHRFVSMLAVALIAATVTIAAQQQDPLPLPLQPPLAPLQINGTQFVPALRGGVLCCTPPSPAPPPNLAERDGWTLGLNPALNTLAAAGLNVVHFRTGPYWVNPTYTPYGSGPQILPFLRQQVAAANALGLYVEIDLVDHWAFRNKVADTDHFYNFWNDKCAVTHGAPNANYLGWVDQIVDATGDLQVLYNTGNESWLCNPALAWEQGLRDKVKDRLALRGFTDRPVGSSYTAPPALGVRPTFDYRSFGDTTPDAYVQALQQNLIPRDVPAVLVEAHSNSPANWLAAIQAAEALGAYVMVWRGDMPDDAFRTAVTVPKPTPPPALSFHPLTPCRAVDTRQGSGKTGAYGPPALPGGADRVFPLASPCGLPATAQAVMVNLTVTQPTTAGYLTVYSAGQPVPPTSSLNVGAQQTRANTAIVSPKMVVRCGMGPTATAQVIVDVVGYFD
jgi:hypothetical protein